MTIAKKTTLINFAILAAINIGLFFLLSPKSSFFLEEVNSYFLKSASNGFSNIHNLIYLYYWLSYHLWGTDPFFYHLVNTIVHTFNVLLIYLLALRLSNNTKAALISALLFSVHYMNTAVLFITNRIDELSAAFLMLCSIYAFDRFMRSGRKKYYVFSLLLFCIAPALKLSALILPLLILSYSIFYDSKEKLLSRIKKGIYRSSPFGAYGILFFSVLLLLESHPALAQLPFVFIQTSTGHIIARIHCFISNFTDRILNITTFYKFIFVPYDFQSASIESYQNSISHFQICSAGILIFLLFLFAYIKKPHYKFIISWLLISPVVYLFHRFPSEFSMIKEKYLYIPLIGGCMLIGFLVEETGRRVTNKFKSVLQWSIITLLIIPLLFSWSKRSYYRDIVGEITKQGQELTRGIIYSADNPYTDRVFYLFLPYMIYRYQTFSGNGDLVKAVLPSTEDPSFIDAYMIERPPTTPISELFYMYIGIVNEKINYSMSVDSDLNPSKIVKRGMDSAYPPWYERHILYYYNMPYDGIEDITDYIIPKTKVVFNITPPQSVHKLYIRGDFNNWTKTPLVLKEGKWQIVLLLNPGCYRYNFVSDKRELFVCSSTKGTFSSLAVVNYGLPVGLGNLAKNKFYDKIITCKQTILFNPKNPYLHRQLADLYRKAGFSREAYWEEVEAAALEKKACDE